MTATQPPTGTFTVSSHAGCASGTPFSVLARKWTWCYEKDVVRRFDSQYANADKRRRERSSSVLNPSQMFCIDVGAVLILREYGRKGRRTLLQKLQGDRLVEWWPGFGTARAWDFGSAAPLWNRMAAACGIRQPSTRRELSPHSTQQSQRLRISAPASPAVPS